MSRYHVNPETMKVGVCKAKEGNCPFGNIEHYPTKKEAENFASKELEKTHGLLAEMKPLKKLTRKSFTQSALEGPVQIGENLYYVTKRVDSENFDLNPELKKQLEQEGKYGRTYVSFITRDKDAKGEMDNLPVFGNSDRYETKWLFANPEDAINKDLRERNQRLLKRANEMIDKKKANKSKVL